MGHDGKKSIASRLYATEDMVHGSGQAWHSPAFSLTSKSHPAVTGVPVKGTEGAAKGKALTDAIPTVGGGGAQGPGGVGAAH